MNFIDAVKTCLTKYANFNGRARRSEYWYFILFTVLLRIPFLVLYQNETIDLILSLVFLLPSLAAGIRRMHDVGKSGWFILIPIYNLILACTNGDAGSNEYGYDPKGDILEDEINSIGTNN